MLLAETLQISTAAVTAGAATLAAVYTLIQIGTQIWGKRSEAARSRQSIECQYDHAMVKEQIGALLSSQQRLTEAVLSLTNETASAREMAQQHHNEIMHTIRRDRTGTR